MLTFLLVPQVSAEHQKQIGCLVLLVSLQTRVSVFAEPLAERLTRGVCCVLCLCLQTVQYIQPHHAAQRLGQAELLVIDEAAAIPLPMVKAMLGPYLVFLCSTGARVGCGIPGLWSFHAPPPTSPAFMHLHASSTNCPW